MFSERGATSPDVISSLEAGMVVTELGDFPVENIVRLNVRKHTRTSTTHRQHARLTAPGPKGRL
jgi:hypothetical protein